MALHTHELVPEVAEQARLIDGLANLVRQVGFDQLIAWPVFLPTNEHFPDSIRGTIGGVRKLIRRLLAYADLGELFVSISVFDSQNPYSEVDENGEEHRLPEHTAAWFAGIDSDTCRFGVDAQLLHDGEYLVGVLCHEVAHAFRHEHNVVVLDRQTEEELTDLTTVLLGFGIFTTNNSYLYRSGGSIEGTSVSHYWSEQRAGYLQPVQLSFLLALQSVLRGTIAKELRVLHLHQLRLWRSAEARATEMPKLQA